MEIQKRNKSFTFLLLKNTGRKRLNLKPEDCRWKENVSACTNYNYHGVNTLHILDCLQI